jgi:hypothetical protein
VSLERESKTANEVRAPAVRRGKAVIVTRYRRDIAKVALVNPDDLAMLERSHELLESAGQLEPPAASDAQAKALQAEDRPGKANRVESPKKIAEILEL